MNSFQVALVRHGRASAGWDAALDPEIDELGRSQARDAAVKLDQIFANREVQIISSPMLRCQQTAIVFQKLRSVNFSVNVSIADQVAEIPSPVGVPMSSRLDWLRTAMQGTWADLGDEYVSFRNRCVEFVRSLSADTVVFSHFIAINAVIGALTNDDRLVIRKLDNCSITLLTCEAAGKLQLSQGGHEADTLIR